MRIVAAGGFVLATLSGVCAGQAQERGQVEWSGAYVGAHLGLGASHLIAKNLMPNSVATGNFWTNTNGEYFNLNGRGGLGGLQFGYQQAFQGLVIGAEASGSFARMTATKTSPYFPASDRESSRFGNRFGAVAKVGVPFGDFLPYLKFGYANTDFKYRALDSVNNGALTMRSRLNGFQVGAGLDYAVTRNCHLGLEYSGSFFRTRRAGVTTSTPFVDFSEYYGFRAAQHLVSLRANYFFGGL